MLPLIDIAKIAGKGLLEFFKKHGALLCTIGTGIGVGGTAVFSALDTRNYLQAVADEEKKLGRPLTAKERLVIGVTEYLRTGVCGATTIALSWGSYGINKKALTVANSSLIVLGKQLEMTQDAYREYREETLRYLPETEAEAKKFEKVIGGRHSDVPTDEMIKKGNIIFASNDDKVLHFKELDTGMEYFKTYNEFETARNKANADINDCGYCSLNAFHEYMGVNETEIGWDIGWMQLIECEYDARMIFDDHNKPEIVVFVCFTKVPELKW